MTRIAILIFAFAAGSMLTWELFPDFRRLKLKRKFVDEYGIDRKPPGLFVIFRMPIQLILPAVEDLGLPAMRQKYEDQLKQAGIHRLITANDVLALRAVLTVVFMFYGIALMKLAPMLALLPPLFGFFFMDLWLADQVKARKNKIRRELPFVMDMLTLSVEAGLEFTAAINKLSSKMKPSPLREELSIFLREIQLGTSRREALRNLANRVRLMEINSMTAALTQAAEMGASISSTLRAQSEILRATRFTNAEKKGAEASQKMLFPMIVFIVPAVMAILMGPLLLQFFYGS